MTAAPYAGDVTPSQAWAALQASPHAVLVDVRTNAEWAYVGLPDLTDVDRETVCIEWQRFPDGAVNEDFVGQLRSRVGPDAPVYFLCRSGVRSQAAAAAATTAGLGPAFNITDGFEGPTDGDGHRAVAGWKQDGLPWRQG